MSYFQKRDSVVRGRRHRIDVNVACNSTARMSWYLSIGLASCSTCRLIHANLHYNHINSHRRRIGISTDILWRVFHILTEPVPYTFVSINGQNNEAQDHIAMLVRASLFQWFTTDTSVLLFGTGSVEIWKTRHKMSVDIRIFLQRIVSSSCGRPWEGSWHGRVVWRHRAVCLQPAGRRHHILRPVRPRPAPRRRRHWPAPRRTGSRYMSPPPLTGLPRRSCGTQPASARSCRRAANQSSSPASPVRNTSHALSAVLLDVRSNVTLVAAPTAIAVLSGE